jgi:hypothetical protein
MCTVDVVLNKNSQLIKARLGLCIQFAAEIMVNKWGAKILKQ